MARFLVPVTLLGFLKKEDRLKEEGGFTMCKAPFLKVERKKCIYEDL
jgi:hypothetical protein